MILFSRVDKGMTPIGSKTTRQGQPVQSFTKEIIRRGRFIKASADQEFEVTSELLDNWVKQFSRMKENGVKVTIPNMHHNEGDANQNQGYVTNVFREGDSLFMTCDLIGENAIAAASRSDVSIKSIEKFTDGEGNEYDRPLVHVAMVTDPVVPGLSDFVPIAASMKGKKMDWKKIAAALSLDVETLTDETAEEAIIASITERGEKSKKEVEEANTAKEAAVKAKAEVEASLRGKDPDPQVVKLSRKNISHELNDLVAGAKLTPAARDKFASAFLTDEAMTLSLKTGSMEHVETFIEIMKANNPVELRGKSGPQTMELGGHGGGGRSDAMEKEAERRAAAKRK